MKVKKKEPKCDNCKRKARFVCDEGHYYCGKCENEYACDEGDDCPFCEPSYLHEL